MRAKRMAVGDNYYNGSRYCWPPDTCTNQIEGISSSCYPNCNTDLIVEGNVGIGTTSPDPGAKLEVAGNIKLSGATPTYTVVNVGAPVAGSDVATKDYVDAAGGSAIIESACAWRYDYREGPVGIGLADNWGCAPAGCPSGWQDLGIINHEPVSLACSGDNDCNFDATDNNSHPVSVGRSVRLCEKL